jgi:farnesyl diphosphate synthase
MDVAGYLAERVPLVDAHLDALLPKAADPPAELHAAMRHLIFPSGKRLRPALAFAAAEALGEPPQVALPVAAAVELVHSYSLVHDDLPCMDDDALRRGRPTVHVVFGEATAVLAGDALLALAFEAVVTPAGEPLDAARAAAGVLELARAAGAGELVGGQAADLAYEAGPAAADPVGEAARVESVHRRKSAALIAASICGGARLAGASDALLEELWESGRAVGVGFQIADDLLDRHEDDGCSLVRAIGEEAARERSEVLLASALAGLESLGDAAEPLRDLMRFAVHRSI